MILIVGLGNPGTKYEDTRHNIGFMILDALLKKLTQVQDSIWEKKNCFNSQIAKIKDDLILAKPLSFMNASGEAISKIMSFYKIPVFGLYVIHDDVDLPLGKIKITVGHGSAGHRGVTSMIEKLGSNNFVRIRVGVGKDRKIATDKFVLSPFRLWEKGRVNSCVKKTVKAVETILKEGVEKAANKFNQ